MSAPASQVDARLYKSVNEPARRLALVNNAELVIDDVSGFVRDHDYQRRYQLDHFNIPCRRATPGSKGLGSNISDAGQGELGL